MAFPFDDKLRDYLRTNNMFGGDMGPRQMNPQQQQVGPNPNMLSPEEEEYYNMGDFDFTKTFNEHYHPESQAGDRLNSMMDRMPQRENPRLWRRIAATAFSAGAPENVERTLYGPYHQKLQDWQTGLAPALKAAELEKSNNANLRSVAASVASGERSEHNLRRQIAANRAGTAQANRRLDQQAGRYATLERQGDERIDIAKINSDINAKRAKGGQFEEDDYGSAFMVYKDGTREEVKGWRGLTFRQKQDIIGDNRAKSQRDRLAVRLIKDPANPNGPPIYGIVNLDTNEIVPGSYTETPTPRPNPNSNPEKGGAGGTVDPNKGKPAVAGVAESGATQALGQQRDIQVTAKRARDFNPGLSKYLKFNKNDQFVEIEKPGMFFGPSEADYETLYKAIYGEGGSPSDQQGTVLSRPGNRPQQAAPATNKPTVRKDGKTHVRNKETGETGWVTDPDTEKYDLIP